MNEEPQAVCAFGKTKYDSRIFDNLYRVYGTEDGGTVLSAYWKDELKSFKINVPYQIISQLIEGMQVGALCVNYDWIEINFDGSPKREFNINEWLKSEPEMYTMPSNQWCLEIACKASYSTVDELINSAERIKDYCKQIV